MKDSIEFMQDEVLKAVRKDLSAALPEDVAKSPFLGLLAKAVMRARALGHAEAYAEVRQAMDNLSTEETPWRDLVEWLEGKP